MSDSSASPSARLPMTVIRIAAVYILLGALAKLRWGTPADLPAILLSLTNDWSLRELLFAMAVVVEVFIAVLALLAPRLGWGPVVALLVIFTGILIAQLFEGAASCGCFGTAVTVHPAVMLGVDGILLAALLGTRPWSRLAPGHRVLWPLGVAFGAAIAASVLLAAVAAGQREPAVRDAGDVPSVATTEEPDVADETVAAIDTPAPVAPRTASPAWKLPAHFPRYVKLEPARWIGRSLGRTTLATWADTSSFPADAHLIFYYDTCKHCAAHLAELARAAGEGAEGTGYVLIQLPTEPGNRHPVAVDAMPPGQHVALPLGTKWLIQTPWDVLTVDGVVTEAIPGFDD